MELIFIRSSLNANAAEELFLIKALTATDSDAAPFCAWPVTPVNEISKRPWMSRRELTGVGVFFPLDLLVYLYICCPFPAFCVFDLIMVLSSLCFVTLLSQSHQSFRFCTFKICYSCQLLSVIDRAEPLPGTLHERALATSQFFLMHDQTIHA